MLLAGDVPDPGVQIVVELGVGDRIAVRDRLGHGSAQLGQLVELCVGGVHRGLGRAQPSSTIRHSVISTASSTVTTRTRDPRIADPLDQSLGGEVEQCRPDDWRG